MIVKLKNTAPMEGSETIEQPADFEPNDLFEVVETTIHPETGKEAYKLKGFEEYGFSFAERFEIIHN